MKKISLAFSAIFLMSVVLVAANSIIMKIEFKNGSVRYIDTESVDDFSIVQLETLPQVPETHEITEEQWRNAYMVRSGFFNDMTANLVLKSTFVPNDPTDYKYELSSKDNSITPIKFTEESSITLACQPTGYTDPIYGEIWMAGKATYNSEILGEVNPELSDGEWGIDRQTTNYLLKLDAVCYAPGYGDGKTWCAPTEILLVSEYYHPLSVDVDYSYTDEPHKRVYTASFKGTRNLVKSVRGVYAVVDDSEVNAASLELIDKFAAKDFDFSFDLSEGSRSFSVTPEKNSWLIYTYEYTDCFDNVKALGSVAQMALTYVEPFTGNGVHFPAVDTPVEVYNDSAPVDIELRRLSTNGTCTVNINSAVTDAGGNEVTGVFTVPSSVTFAHGEKSAKINIGMDFTGIKPGATFNITLTLPDEEECPEGALCKTIELTYTHWGEFMFYGMGSGSFSLFGVYDKEAPVYVAESLTDNSRRYRFGDFDVSDFSGTAFLNSRNINLYVEETPVPAEVAPDNEAGRYYYAHMEPFATGDDTSLGEMLWSTDVYTLRTELGIDIYLSNTDQELKNLSYYDSKTGRFTIYTIWYHGTTPISATREYFQLPGFSSDAAEVSSRAKAKAVSGAQPASAAIIDARRLSNAKTTISFDRIEF